MTTYGAHHHQGVQDEHYGHDGPGHGHDDHPDHPEHGHVEHSGHDHGHNHGHDGHKGRPGAVELEHDLSVLVAEAQHVGTERGVRAYERLVAVLTRPGMRIARGKLNDLGFHGEANLDDLNEIVYNAHFQLYRMLDRYVPGTPVMPLFATIVRNKAIDFVRQQHHTRAKNRPEMISYEEFAFVFAAHEDDVHTRLDIEEVMQGLAPDDHRVLSLLGSGHTTAEIAAELGRSEPWVRARRKALRAAFCVLR
jgi:RNA polymerase sigma factor (sigma-70 family)